VDTAVSGFTELVSIYTMKRTVTII